MNELKKPIFSIIVPCYNQDKYLEECLNSVLNQTFQNWECIIVNDGSTDNSESIALSYHEKDIRFRYFSKKNSGLASTRNYGIKLSHGTFILPLDGDDKIGENYLTKAFEIFNKKHDTKLVYCEARFFGDENEVWKLKDYSYTNILLENCIFCSAIFKKSDYLLTDGYDVNMIYGYEDWEFWLQILKSTDSVIRIKSVEFFYRKRGDSMISFVKNKDNLTKMTDYMFKKHENKYIETFGIENNLNGYIKIHKELNILKSIKSSFSYKIFYKIEKELGRFIKKLRNILKKE